MGAGSRARRRKLQQVQRQERLHGEEEGPDLLSRLPSGILGDIITLLPTKDAARTQTLSRRWRRLWRSAPLNLEDSDRSGAANIRIKRISDILSAHPGPARRLSLHCFGDYDDTTLDGWLRSPALNNLQELELWYNIQTPVFPLPPSVLRFTSSLRALTIESFTLHLPANTSHELHYSRLKRLTLKDVSFLEGSLDSVLSRCPALESLMLDNIVVSHGIRVSSPTLRSLGVSVSRMDPEGRLGELIVENAPHLERLIPRTTEGISIRVIGAHNLKVLGYLSHNVSKIELDTTVFQKMVAVSLTAVVRTVKILALRTNYPTLDMVLDFLKCFPCLEKLYIKSFLHGNMENVPHDLLHPTECLDLHLKKIVLIHNDWQMSDVNLAKFFVRNARVLESMKIVTCINYNTTRMARRLRLRKRASWGAQFHFACCRQWDDFIHTKHIHDLSMADPFDMSLCRCHGVDFL